MTIAEAVHVTEHVPEDALTISLKVCPSRALRVGCGNFVLCYAARDRLTNIDISHKHGIYFPS